ncbi:saxitoxin and tetrodotoxin-binding protein 1-like [Anabas testudineus]|uniref:saxitoxin and tetrodotoxin-binding protein 1-like n=1 Tax=Anabas testudineus TaxID=64144 RepID=UPI000E453B43|nr:saxitoxin and tetrodotoxin-binding protein 1-like [Anabas testudineus]
MCFLTKVSVVTLLLSLTVVAETPDECVHQNTALSDADLQMIFGKWILHEAYALSSQDYFSQVLKIINSSQTEFIPSGNQDTVIFKQTTMRDDTCTRFLVNFTVVGNKIQYKSTARNYTSEGEFLKTCDDCLLMRYTTVMGNGEKGTFLLFYKKTETLSQADQEKVKQQSKCLGFLQPPEFIYKQAELCAEESDATKPKEPVQ